MPDTVTPSTEVEETRIRAAYARRQSGTRYSWLTPSYTFSMQQRERRVLELMRQELPPLSSLRILDVGCGSGEWIRDFVKWGVPPDQLTGIDLLPDRIAGARARCPAGATLVCGSASRLEFPDASFDLAIQSTVFTSILDPGMRRGVATEMLRVLRPGGAVLWYDYYVDNPRNADVRAVRRPEIVELFAGCEIDLRRITLAPPISRALAGHAWVLCEILERLPLLCTHYLGLIRKQ